jgi:hypothetical protein
MERRSRRRTGGPPSPPSQHLAQSAAGWWEAEKTGNPRSVRGGPQNGAPDLSARGWHLRGRSPEDAARSVTRGLRWAPDTWPRAKIRARRAAPVARELARSASPMLPAESLSPMIPEPTMAMRRKAVPAISADARPRSLIRWPAASSARSVPRRTPEGRHPPQQFSVGGHQRVHPSKSARRCAAAPVFSADEAGAGQS